MLFPNDDGVFECQGDCEFQSTDVFDLIEHTNTRFAWSVKVSPNYSLNLYDFFSNLNSILNAGDLEQAYDLVQDMSVVLANAGVGEFEEFMNECYVRKNIDSGINQIERMLQENGRVSNKGEED